MADYQKVEINKEEPTGAFSEEDMSNLEQQEEALQEEEVVQERPEWLPEKFGNPEDMAAAYAELESAYTQKQQDTQSGEEGVEASDDLPVQITNESMSEFAQEFTETGDVSEASRQKITEMGLPREYVDQYIEGQKAVVHNHFNNIYKEVGGSEAYKEMVSWAADSLPEGEQNAFNDAITSGNQDNLMFAIRSLKSRWQGSNDAPTPLIQGNTGHEFAGTGFRSLAELTAAMKDPRYQKDPSYRQDIETRLSNSNIL